MDKDTDTNEIIPCIVDIIPTTDVNNIKYIDFDDNDIEDYNNDLLIWVIIPIQNDK